MRKQEYFWILALIMFFAFGCVDNESLEPEAQVEKRQQLKENLTHEVTQAEARENLEQLLLKMKIPSTRGGSGKEIPPITSVYTRGKAAIATRAGEEIEPYFHIFNFGDNEGFAIMSGDDRMEPLLALTFQGELTPETVIDNPGFEIAYSRMEDYYVYRVTSSSIDIDFPIPPLDSIPGPTTEDTIIFHEMPMGYCPVEWGQEWPYNKYCRMQPGNVLLYTGCARIAVAQLMSMYEHPDSVYFPYQDSTYHFNWDEMNLYTSNTNGTSENEMDSTKYNQIARLIYLLGTSVNLNVVYNPGNASIPGSSNPDNIPRTFENFGYANGGERITYNTDTVVQELLDGYPVLIGASDESDGQPRHRWLGHGVGEFILTLNHYHPVQGWISSTNSLYYILCNFGWNGFYNGYYLSEVFNTNKGPTYPFAPIPSDSTRSETEEKGNFKYNMDVVLNIRKEN